MLKAGISQHICKGGGNEMELIGLLLGGLLTVGIAAGVLGTVLHFTPTMADWLTNHPEFPFWPLAAALLGCTCILIGWLLLKQR